MSIVFTGKDVIAKGLQNTLTMTIDQIADVVEKEAKASTPVKTGYTRSQWKKRTAKRDFEVKNSVPWIGKLEAGSSKQAPKGIIGPTLSKVKGQIK